jgi:RNA polymerase sigma-70 factor (ECF subfamily)
VWDRLEGTRIDSLPTQRRHRVLLWAGLGAAVAAGLVLALAGLRTFDTLDSAPSDAVRSEAALAREPTQDRPASVREGKFQAAAPTDAAQLGALGNPNDSREPSKTAATSERRARPPRSGSTVVVPEPNAAAGALADETKLLAAARRALSAGDFERCVELLRQHTERFGTGLLAEEHAALRAVALCSSGRDEVGRRAAIAFARQYPDSPLSARVRAACQSATASGDGAGGR